MISRSVPGRGNRPDGIPFEAFAQGRRPVGDGEPEGLGLSRRPGGGVCLFMRVSQEKCRIYLGPQPAFFLFTG